MEMMSQDISKLAFALSKVQGTVGLIPKNKTAKVPMKSGGSYSYSYADLASIWESIRRPLLDNELAVSQVFTEIGDKSYLQTVLAHSSGQWIKSQLQLDGHEKIQELGSEITYLRRYGISSILGIATDEDEDGKIANEAPRKAQEATNAPRPTVTPLTNWKPAKPAVNAEKGALETLEDVVMETFGTNIGLQDFIDYRVAESQKTAHPATFMKVVEAALASEGLTTRFCELYKQFMKLPDRAIDE